MSEAKMKNIQPQILVLFIRIKKENAFERQLRIRKQYNNFLLVAHVCNSECHKVSFILNKITSPVKFTKTVVCYLQIETRHAMYVYEAS